MKYSVTTLENGLRIVTVPLPSSATVTVLTLVNTGSDYEHEEESGISHFLEHMCFKGTLKRPSAHSINLELDSLGAETNAFTDHEVTGYYAKGDARHWKQFLDIISDVYLNSTLPMEEIEKEKGVVIEEINMYEDMPNHVIAEKMESFMYGTHPIGRPIIGTKDHVRSFTRDMLVSYRTRRYVPQSTVIVIAGPVTETSVVKEVKKQFGEYAGKKTAKIGTVSIAPRANPILTVEKKTDQVHAVIGFGGYKRSSAKSKNARLLAGALGSGMSSRLFQLLREELGVCYYVSAGQSLRTHSGRFIIASGIAKEKVDMVVTKILEECKKLKTHPIEKEELTKIKNYLVGMTKMGLESSDEWAYFYGSQLLLDGKIKNIDEKIITIESITSAQIMAAAQEIFTPNNVYIGSIGPAGHTKLTKADIKRLLS